MRHGNEAHCLTLHINRLAWVHRSNACRADTALLAFAMTLLEQLESATEGDNGLSAAVMNLMCEAVQHSGWAGGGFWRLPNGDKHGFSVVPGKDPTRSVDDIKRLEPNDHQWEIHRNQYGGGGKWQYELYGEGVFVKANTEPLARCAALIRWREAQ